MTFTVKNHGIIEGSHYGSRQPLKMVTAYRSIRKMPNNYRMIDSVQDLTDLVQPYTKMVKMRSENRRFLHEIIQELRSGKIVRVGPYVITHNIAADNYEVYHKVSVV